MKIQILGDNVEITEIVKTFIQNKFINKLEKHLKNLSEDEKKGHIRIQELGRWGFSINFDMWLPGKKHIYAKEIHNNLETAIVRLSHEAERQINDYMSRVKIKYNYR